MRDPGLYPLDKLISFVDGSTAYRVRPDFANDAMADSWNASLVEPDPGIEWTVDDEPDDLEISLTVEAYASLVGRARTHCPGCTGPCER
jgi:hypothetical protein